MSPGEVAAIMFGAFGVLIVLRKPLLRRGSVLSLLLTLPSLVGGLAALSIVSVL